MGKPSLRLRRKARFLVTRLNLSDALCNSEGTVDENFFNGLVITPLKECLNEVSKS